MCADLGASMSCRDERNPGGPILVWHAAQLDAFLPVLRALFKASEACDGRLDVLPPNLIKPSLA